MFWKRWNKKKEKRLTSNLKMGMQINLCKDCSKYNIGASIYESFNWNGCIRAIGYDKSTNEILLAEEQIMRIIQSVNPAQTSRKIRLVNQDELLNR